MRKQEGAAHGVPAPRAWHRGAFTLLELTLALGLTVIVGTILASSLYTAFRARDTIEKTVEAAQSVNVACNIMAQELPLALPPTPSSNTNTMFGFSLIGETTTSVLGSFIGTDSTVDFFLSGSEPKAAVQSDVRQVQYLLVNDPNTAPSKAVVNLVRRVRTNILQESPEDPPDEVLARDVIKLNFKYYDGLGWGDTWDSTQQGNHLPVAVQITLEQAPLREGQGSRVEVRTVHLPCGVANTDESGLGGWLP